MVSKSSKLKTLYVDEVTHRKINLTARSLNINSGELIKKLINSFHNKNKNIIPQNYKLNPKTYIYDPVP